MKPLVFAIGFHTLHIVFAIEDRASVWAGCFPPFDCKTKEELPKKTYEWAFENQPTAPCLDLNTKFGYPYFPDGLPVSLKFNLYLFQDQKCILNLISSAASQVTWDICTPVVAGTTPW